MSAVRPVCFLFCLFARPFVFFCSFVLTCDARRRRLRKTDNDRLARTTGATIVSRTDEIKESDVGTLCGLFEIEKIGDE